MLMSAAAFRAVLVDAKARNGAAPSSFRALRVRRSGVWHSMHVRAKLGGRNAWHGKRLAKDMMMILLSNGGSNSHRSKKPSDALVVGTVDGVVVLQRAD